LRTSEGARSPQFDFLKQRYPEKGDTAGLAALEAIGKPDPKNVGQYFGSSRPIRHNMNASDTAWLNGLGHLYSDSGDTETALKAIGTEAAHQAQP
jgi:hypothetical protein